MKRILLFFLMVTGASAYGQGHYNGQKTISVNYLQIDKGQGINVNFQEVVGNKFLGYRIEATALKKDQNLNLYDQQYIVDYKNLSLGCALSYSLESVIPHPLYVQAYVGALYSYEDLNNGTYNINGIPFNKPKQNTFGGYIGCEIELAVFKKLSIVGNIRNNFTNSEINKSLLSYGGGLKLSIN